MRSKSIIELKKKIKKKTKEACNNNDIKVIDSRDYFFITKFKTLSKRNSSKASRLQKRSHILINYLMMVLEPMIDIQSISIIIKNNM